ncbi:MAG TPA: hypothetical protein VL947_11090, partial [Cytophagales bacterium]|nr:hypothetical protein [Cytophagales bacterium]
MYKHILSLLVVSSLLLSSCDKVQEHKSATDSVRTTPAKDTAVNASNIVPPLDIQLKFEQFKIDPQKSNTLISEKGSKIIVPSHAFTKLDGSPVQDEVVLQYREFREVGELIASGIPMTYHHNGKKENFITAGMFELVGKTISGEEVEIADHKAIEVDMASTTASTVSGVNFYYLEPETSEWHMLGTSIRRNSRPKEEPQQDTQIKTNNIPVGKADKDAYKFELDLDYSKMAELKDYKDII